MIDKEALLKSIDGKTYLLVGDFIDSINSGTYDVKLNISLSNGIYPCIPPIQIEKKILNIEEKFNKIEGLIKSADSFLSESKSKILYLEQELLKKNQYNSDEDSLIRFLKEIFPNYAELEEKINERKSCGNCHCQRCI